MLQSMTGYGRAEYTHDDIKAVVEVRSVNHRFLDISLRMSRSLYGLEKYIRKEVSTYAARGKVDVSIQLEHTAAHDLSLRLNTQQAVQIADLLRQLQQAAGCTDKLDTTSLLTFKDLLFEQQELESDLAASQRAIEPALKAALQALQAMQMDEGEETARDIRERINTVQTCVGKIETNAPQLLSQRQETLREKIKNLCEGVIVDESRVTQEIALLADRSDVTEELVRLKSHINQFQQWLDAQGAIGRKLDFLMQEMNREINTIGSKISDSDIALLVVEVKNELEKIREQIQNIM
jgi:uncharacterized protein (TIGR00255 family)